MHRCVAVDLHPRFQRPVTVIVDQHIDFNLQRGFIQRDRFECFRTKIRTPLQGFGRGNRHQHVVAGQFNFNVLGAADEHQRPGAEDPAANLAGDSVNLLDGPFGQLADRPRPVAGLHLPGRTRGGVVSQRAFRLDQRHTAFTAQPGGKRQPGNATADNQNVTVFSHRGYGIAEPFSYLRPSQPSPRPGWPQTL